MATQSERKEATRSAVVGAARALFTERGFAATTVDEVAIRAGVAKGAVYHHFPSKEAIFERVFRDATEDAVRIVHAAADQQADPLKAIIAGARAYIQAYALGLDTRILLVDGPAVLGWLHWRDIDEEYFCGMVLMGLGKAMDEGVIERQPLAPLSALLVGALSEIAISSTQMNDVSRCNANKLPRAEWHEYADSLEKMIERLRVSPPQQ